MGELAGGTIGLVGGVAAGLVAGDTDVPVPVTGSGVGDRLTMPHSSTAKQSCGVAATVVVAVPLSSFMVARGQ